MEIKFNQENFNNWNHKPGYNYMFLVNMQNLANDKFRLPDTGVITLYEVLLGLGMRDIPQTAKTLAWMKGAGDEYIDFGITPEIPDDPGCFHGTNPDYILNFNCENLENLVEEILKK